MRVAITRPRSQLTEGWLAVPVTSRHPIQSGLGAFSEALNNAEAGTWVAVTSPHTFRLLQLSKIQIPQALRIACVGEATAQGSPRTPDFVGPPPASAQSMVNAVPNGKGRVLFPSSAQASQTLQVGLGERGYRVDRFDIYSSEADSGGVRKLAEAKADAIIVTASTAARAIADHWPTGTEVPKLIALGQPTAQALVSCKLPVFATSDTPDRVGLEACLERIDS